MGLEYEPRGFGHFGLIFDQNLPSFEDRVLVALNCVEPSLSWLQKRKWPRAFGVVSIVFGF